MLPLSGDQPDLVAFALEECRIRQAEMLVLFLRPIAVIPMGPNPFPGLSEDDEAKATFDRVGSEADRVGVPIADHLRPDERYLLVGRQRPEVVGDQAFELVARGADGGHRRG